MEQDNGTKDVQSGDGETWGCLVIFLAVIGICAAKIAHYEMVSFFVVLGCFSILVVVVAFVGGSVEAWLERVMLKRCQKMICPGCGLNFKVNQPSDIKRWMAHTIDGNGICHFSQGISIYCAQCNKLYHYDRNSM